MSNRYDPSEWREGEGNGGRTWTGDVCEKGRGIVGEREGNGGRRGVGKGISLLNVPYSFT